MSSIMEIIVFGQLFWIIYLTYIFIKKNQKSTPASTPTDSTTPVADLSDQVRQVNRKIDDLLVTVPKTIQKFTVTRFNPFHDVGGDQSFIMTLLDGQNNGIVITSLHNRENTRVYAKPVKGGQGDNVTLSSDEKSAILKAQKSRNGTS